MVFYFSPMKKFTRNNAFHGEGIANELFLIDVQGGKYFALNQTATHVWSILHHPMSFDEIMEQMMCKYDIGFASCMSSLATLLQRMCQLKMIVESREC